MRILFDNGTPRQLRRQLFGHDVETCRERGWDRLTNGELLDQAEGAGDHHGSRDAIPTEYVEQAFIGSGADEHCLAAGSAPNGGDTQRD